eukprot:scaffold8485_cov277-Pinguiococcus_pyrenoidosus.AAC.1
MAAVIVTAAEYLVDHHAGDLHTILLAHAAIQLKLVEGAAQAPVGNEDHLRSQHARYFRIVHVHDAAHTRVPRPLHHHHVAVPRERLKRAQDGVLLFVLPAFLQARAHQARLFCLSTLSPDLSRTACHQ